MMDYGQEPRQKSGQGQFLGRADRFAEDKSKEQSALRKREPLKTPEDVAKSQSLPRQQQQTRRGPSKSLDKDQRTILRSVGSAILGSFASAFRRRPLTVGGLFLLVSTYLILIWMAHPPRYVTDEYGQSRRYPPGSKLGNYYLPFVGETLDYGMSSFLTAADRVKRNGHVSYSNILFQDTILLSGSEALRHFYNDTLVQRENAFPTFQLPVLFGGKISPMMDGLEHAERRALVNKAFNSHTAIRTHLEKINAITRAYVHRWGTLRNFEWEEEYMRYTATLSTALLFSNNDPVTLQSLSQSISHAPKNTRWSRFYSPLEGKSIDRLVERLNRLIYSFTSVPISIPFTPYSKGLRARDELLKWYDTLMTKHHQRFNTDKEFNDALSIVLKSLPSTVTQSRQALLPEINFLTFATYAMYSPLTSMTIALSQFPEIAEKIRAEVHRVYPDNRNVTLENLHQLEYTGRFINEVRRYFPLLAGMFGTAKQSFQVDRYYVPKGSHLVGSFYTTLHDHSEYRRPQLFDPDRFIGGKQPRGGWQYGYVPHGGGLSPHAEGSTHRCVGEDLTKYTMKIMLVHLMKTSSWVLPSQDLSYNMNLFLPEPYSKLIVKEFRHIPDGPIVSVAKTPTFPCV